MDSNITVLTGEYKPWLDIIALVCFLVMVLATFGILATLDFWRSDRFQRRSKLHVGRWNIAFDSLIIIGHHTARKQYQEMQEKLQATLLLMSNLVQEIETKWLEVELPIITDLEEIAAGVEKDVPMFIAPALIGSIQSGIAVTQTLFSARTTMSNAVHQTIRLALEVIEAPLPERPGTAYYLDMQQEMRQQAHSALTTLTSLLDMQKFVTEQLQEMFARLRKENDRLVRLAKEDAGRWAEIEKFANLYKEIGHKFDNQEAFARKYDISLSTLVRMLKEYERTTGEKIRPGRGRKAG